MANGAYIRVALSNNSAFRIVSRATPPGCGARDYFQKTPRGLYLGQCLVTFSLTLEVAILSTGAFRRLCWVSYCTLSKNLVPHCNY